MKVYLLTEKGNVRSIYGLFQNKDDANLAKKSKGKFNAELCVKDCEVEKESVDGYYVFLVNNKHYLENNDCEIMCFSNNDDASKYEKDNNISPYDNIAYKIKINTIWNSLEDLDDNAFIKKPEDDSDREYSLYDMQSTLYKKGKTFLMNKISSEPLMNNYVQVCGNINKNIFNKYLLDDIIPFQKARYISRINGNTVDYSFYCNTSSPILNYAEKMISELGEELDIKFKIINKDGKETTYVNVDGFMEDTNEEAEMKEFAKKHGLKIAKKKTPAKKAPNKNVVKKAEKKPALKKATKKAEKKTPLKKATKKTEKKPALKKAKKSAKK